MTDYLGKYSVERTDRYLAKLGFAPQASDTDAINAHVKNLKPAQEKKLLHRLGKAGHLQNLMRQTEEARALEIFHKDAIRQTINVLSKKYDSAGLVDALGEINYAETTTTHPLQIATPKEDYLSSAYTKRYRQLIDLKDKTALSHADRQEIKKIEKQLGRIVRRFEHLPSQNLDKFTAVDEARIKIPYTKIAAQGWADTNTVLKRAVYDASGTYLEKNPTSFASWIGLDNDRNNVLKANDIFETARLKKQSAFQLHAKALGTFANSTDNLALKEQISTLRRRLLNTAHQSPQTLHVPKGAYSNYGVFETAEEYTRELRRLRNMPEFSAEKWRIEELVSLSDNAGFHLVQGEARQNAQVLDDVIKLAYKQASLKMPSADNISVKGDFARFTHLADNFDVLKHIDLDKLAFESLGKERGAEARKLVDCLKNYKVTRDMYSDKALSRLVIAESRSPNDVLAMRILSENAGVVTDKKNGLKIIPLVESSADKRFMRSFIDKVLSPHAMSGSGGRAMRLFTRTLEIMQAASDTLRVNGQIYGIRSINSFSNYINRVFSGSYLYFGLGTDGQRTHGDLPHKFINSLFSGIKRFRQTVQGSDVQLVYRNAATARGHSLATLSHFIGNAFAPDMSDIYKKHDPAMQAWSKASLNLHGKMVTGTTAKINQVLNTLTPTRFVGALNTGSRSGKGVFGIAYDKVSDFPAVKHATSRAISLAFGGKSSGLNATTIGMGKALDRLAVKDPQMIGKLHEAYKAVPGFRLSVDSTARVVSYGNHSAIRTFFQDALKKIPAVARWVNYHEADTTLLRKYIPQIIHGVGTAKNFDDLSFVGKALGNPYWARITQAVASKNLSQVLMAGANASLMKTRAGASFKIMRLAAATLTRITGRFA